MQADSWEGLTSTLQAAFLAVGPLDHLKSAAPSPSGPRAAMAQSKDGLTRLRPVALGKLTERWKTLTLNLPNYGTMASLMVDEVFPQLSMEHHTHQMLLFNDLGNNLSILWKHVHLRSVLRFMCIIFKHIFPQKTVISNGDCYYCNGMI